MLSGIITAFLLLLFLAIVIWAWQPRNKKGFDDAAQLAVEDDEKTAGNAAGRDTTGGKRP